MTDIVERLRHLAKLLGFDLTATLNEAADEIARLRAALQFVADGYDNQDVNHVDFRVKAYQVALDALAISPADRLPASGAE